jgi:hypothetical protein
MRSSAVKNGGGASLRSAFAAHDPDESNKAH